MLYLYLLLIGIVFLASLFRHVCHFSRNRTFAQKLRVLEELMDSELRCVFGIIGISPSCVKISGMYRGKRISFSSKLEHLCRFSAFRLKSAGLPKQKLLTSSYPTVAENIAQVGNTLVRYEDCDFLSEDASLERDIATKILDGLVDAAERLEAPDS